MRNNSRYLAGLSGVFIALILVALVFLPLVAAAGQFKQIVVATGSPFELGLVQAVAKRFEKEFDCKVRFIKTPTGPGLELGRNGLCHVTMGHNREATAKFVEEGLATKRTDLMYNMTIIVGPKGDPAKIEGLEDLAEAHKRIMDAEAKYLSRGDGGGMHILELKIWQTLAADPSGRAWYEVSNKFMLGSLLHSEKNAQYHMLDSSTWVLHKSKVPDLKLLVVGPKNEYEMCLVSAEKNPNLKYGYELAEKFYDFCISREGQNIIAEFGVKEYGEPVYYPWANK